MYMYTVTVFCLPSAEHHRELEDLRLAHADTINELEKMRKLLQLQHNINKDYKKEVHVLYTLYVKKILYIASCELIHNVIVTDTCMHGQCACNQYTLSMEHK